MNYDLRVLSLGAGVQSSAMYLMALDGVLAPRPDVAIFADTQSEPDWVYRHLKWLKERGGKEIPIHVVSHGNLLEDLRRPAANGRGCATIPFWVRNKNGERGLSRRQCTGTYKIKPVEKETRRLLGLKPGQHAKGKYRVQMWIGISADESHRAKESTNGWITRFYPLLGGLEGRSGGTGRWWRRAELEEWLRSQGYPIPRKSSCFFCPFHSAAEWRALREHEPEKWREAQRLDAELRDPNKRMVSRDGFRNPVYLSSTLEPLSEMDLDEENPQRELWGNECEGVCGV